MRGDKKSLQISLFPSVNFSFLLGDPLISCFVNFFSLSLKRGKTTVKLLLPLPLFLS